MSDGRVKMWEPCHKGAVPPDECKHCCPPKEERCPEYREELRGFPGNTPGGLWVDKIPCRVLGEHTVHRDGRGTSWWVEEAEAAVDY